MVQKKTGTRNSRRQERCKVMLKEKLRSLQQHIARWWSSFLLHLVQLMEPRILVAVNCEEEKATIT